MNGRDRGPEDNPNTVSDTADLAHRLGEAMKRRDSRATTEGLDITRSTPEDLLLGRVALESGRITPDQLREALLEQEKAAGRGEKLTLETYFLSRDWLDAAAVAALKAPPIKPPEPVQSPSRYEIQNLVGQGATAMVYRAWDRELKRPVALKMLRETAAMSETARARFRREAQVAAGLSHPNIVAVHDAGERGGQLYLVMELVEGRPFSEMLLDASVDLTRRLSFLEQVSRGVAAAHDHGIVHRDLKPANILITADGTAKVGDFGLAHLVASTTELTKTGATLGTPLYMSPEQVEGRTGEITPRTDVYALGAMLYEILAGRPPHYGGTTNEIYSKIVRDDPIAPRRLRPQTPRNLETIAMRAIEKSPSARYAAAAEFAEDLRRHREGEPVLARPVPAPVRTVRRLLRKPGVPLALAASAALVLVAGGGVGLVAVRKRDRIRNTLQQAATLERNGRTAEAKALFGAALDEDGADDQARAGLARVEAAIEAARRDRERRELSEKAALGLLETARPELDAASRALYDPKATAESLKKHLDGARKLVQEAVDRAPGLAPAHYHLGRVGEIAGDEVRAEAATRKAIEIDPDFAPARYQLGRLLLARSYGLLLGADPEEREARKPEAEKLAREAAAEIERALTRGRGFEDPLHREIAQGLLAQAAGNPLKAREVARSGIEKFPANEGREEFHWLAGLSLTGADQLDEFTRALQIRPKWTLVLLARAGARVVRGDAVGAMADCDEILRLSPGHGPALLNRGIALFRLGRLEEALQDFDRAVAAAPDDPMTRYNRGVTRLRKGDVDGALADFEATLRKSPSFAPALNNRGSARLRKGDVDGAIGDFDAALRLKKDFADARTNRGSALRRKGDLEGALADFDEALRLDPRSAEALFNRALVRLKKDDLKAMLQDLDRAIDAQPGWSEPYVARAQLRRVLGNGAGAREDARRALALGVGPEDRAALEELLKSDE
jgi:serine/threonine-protein kinase